MPTLYKICCSLMEGGSFPQGESHTPNASHSTARSRYVRNPHSPGLCECGLPPVLLTSWTNQNPGRRFWKCAGPNGAQCTDFHWADPEVCARAQVIIPGLLRRIGRLETTIADNKVKMRKLIMLLVASWVVTVVLLFGPKMF